MTQTRGPSSEALGKSPHHPAPSLLASLHPICRVASWDNFQSSRPTKMSENDLKLPLAAASHPSKFELARGYLERREGGWVWRISYKPHTTD